MKLALLALGAIDTMAGTAMVPVDVNAIMVADATGPLIVTVQAATAAGPRDAGLHARLLSSELVTVVTIPPVVFIAIGAPSKVAPRPLETSIDADAAPAARVTATVATLPLAMRLALIPLPTHIYAVGEPAQFSVLPDAVSAGPGVTTNPFTEAEG